MTLGFKGFPQANTFSAINIYEIEIQSTQIRILISTVVKRVDAKQRDISPFCRKQTKVDMTKVTEDVYYGGFTKVTSVYIFDTIMRIHDYFMKTNQDIVK